jgi:ribosomal protein S18 acetylase RimI-like enzyme
MNIRHLEERDYNSIIAVIDEWWGGRQMARLLPRIFFIHFRMTSFAIEEGKEIIGFLVGFVSQTYPDQAYIYFVGIHPDYRRRGMGRELYSRFFEAIRTMGCTSVRCITSPVNARSIAFHTRMGFQLEGITGEHEGVPCTINYELNGEDRVLFVRNLG